MDATTVAVTAFDEPGFTVYLEPEGMMYEVGPRDGLVLRFEPSPSGTPVDVTWLPHGLVIGRPFDASASVTTHDGRALDW